MESASAAPPPVFTGVTGTVRIPFWRAELERGRASLKEAFLARPDTLRVLRDHAKLVDRIVTGIWDECRVRPDCALVAVGGYGRGQLYPHSDIDVLVLLPAAAETMDTASVERFFAAMWDVGLELAHAVRTIG